MRRVHVFGLFISFAGVLCGQSIAYYPLTEIPDVTVWQGDFYTFTTAWEGHTEAVYSLSAYPMPAGQIGLGPADPGMPEVRQFVYLPDAADVEPFEVTIAAEDGVDNFKTTFVVTPLANLPCEQDYFRGTGHTNSTLYDVDDIEIRQLPGGAPYHISVCGTTLHIGGPDDYRNIYDTMLGGAGGRTDMGSLTLTAETVVIHEPVILRRAHITVNARTLRFEGPTARLETKPLEVTTSPGTRTISDAQAPGGTRVVGNDGAPGLSAGDISLNIQYFDTTHQGTKLMMAGGGGQPGGPGQHGQPGISSNPAYRWPSWTITHGYTITFYPADYGYPNHKIIYMRYIEDYLGITRLDSTNGIAMHPTNGGWAQEPGRPGNGGAGGQLTSTIDVTAYANASGGAAGAFSNPGPGKTRFEGGAAGQPEQSLWLDVHYNIFTAWCYIVEPHVTVAGQSYDAKYAANGLTRAPVLQGVSYAWLTPPIAKKRLHGAYNFYLDGDLEMAQGLLEGIREDIAAMQASSEWAALSEEDQLELNMIQDETVTKLYQLANHLDYFGRPAGWAPMLSFEAHLAIFNREVDAAMNTLYLSYWIKRAAQHSQDRQTALTQMRTHLIEEKDRAITEYEQLNLSMPMLMSQATAIQAQIETLIDDIEVKENELIDQARDDLRLPVWKGVLRSMAAGSKMIPLFEPLFGGVVNVATNFDTNQPYDNIRAIAGFADTIVADEIDALTTAVGLAASAASGDVGDTAKGLTEAIVKEVRPNFTGGINDLLGVIDSLEAPESKILAQAAQAKAQDPQFKEYADRLEALLETKKGFVRQFVETTQRMNELADLIAENLMAMDALGLELATVAVYEPRVVMHLETLERRAFDRLLKYHYYLAKAYEYRLLTEYTEPLNLESLFTYLEGQASFGTPEAGSIIPAAQFESLKGIYESSISAIAETIYDLYTDGSNGFMPDETSGVRFTLTQEELDRLNAGEPLRFNLYEMLKLNDFIRPNEENIRILKMAIYEDPQDGHQIQTAPVGGDYAQDAFIVLDIVHSGESRFLWNGQSFLFRSFAKNSSDRIHWESKYYPVGQNVIPTQLSLSNSSLLLTLLEGYAGEDMMLFSRPALWSDVEVRMSVHGSQGRDIDLTYLKLYVEYDFKRRSDSSHLKELHLLTSRHTPGEGTEIGGLSPHFRMNRPDQYGKQDGREACQRFYLESGIHPVGLEAQPFCGEWKFYKWTNRYHQDLPGGPVTSASMEVLPSADQMLLAQYIPISVLEGDVNHDCVVDMDDLCLCVESWLWNHPEAELAQTPNGRVDLTDAAAIFRQWQKTCRDEMEIPVAPLPAAAPMADMNIREIERVF